MPFAYIPRILETAVRASLRTFPVIGISGPRQSGKSTMLRTMLGGKYEYVTFDDHRTIEGFQADPEKFLRINSANVIFDEIQRVPELFRALKVVVDNERSKKGRFILTGSSQFSFMKNVSESLAGRIAMLTLLPFQYAEIPERFRTEALYRGGYPELVTRGFDASELWYSSYLETYLNRDLRDIYNVGDMRDFRRFVRLLAARTAQILNMSELSREIGTAVPTIKKWISILEASHIVFLLPAWHRNLGKRIVKSPKLYFHDTGLVSYLTGVRTRELFERGPMYGPIFENAVVADVLRRELHSGSGAELFYVRTSNGVEVDLVIDRGSDVEYVEIKASETFRPGMLDGIEATREAGEKGILVYRGRPTKYTGGIEILNVDEYLTR